MSAAAMGEDFAQYKVLVADDTVANRTLVKAYLGRLGFPVVLAENGEQAVAVFEHESPDIVLMDVMMPVMDGLAATREIRRRVPHRWVPIVMLSALGTESDVVSGLDTGADDYLVKPLSYQIFAAKMRTVVRTLALQRATELALAEVRAISVAMGEGLVSFAADGSILSSNPAMRALFAPAQSALEASNLFELFPASSTLLQSDMQQLSVNPAFRPPTRTLDVATAQAGLRSFELALSRLPSDGAPRFLGVLRDTTERKRAERELAAYAAELQGYHDEAERENALALEIMQRQVRRGGLDDAALQHKVMPAQRFSGDLVLAERAPDGRLFGLLADATGHGLGAAVSVLPAVTEFYRLVPQGPSLELLIAALSQSLHAAMPVGRFVAAAAFSLDPISGEASVWVGGTPDVLRLSAQGEVLSRHPSRELPLGIDPLCMDEVRCERLRLDAGEQLMLFSDGLIEAENPLGEPFGYDRLAHALAAGDAQARVAAIDLAISTHCQGNAAHDDVSLLVVEAGFVPSRRRAHFAA